MNRAIKFFKWIDPLDRLEKIKDEDSEAYENLEKSGANIGNGPLLVGPMGVIPLTEHNQASKVFNFWMMHSNFDIGFMEKEALEQIPGVETLEIFTRYRARISVGQAFEEKDVLEEIEHVLCPKEKTKVIPKIGEVNDGIKLIQEHLRNRYKFWAIFVLPNGEIDYRTGDSQDIVNDKINEYEGKYSNILKSWEINNDSNQKKSNKRRVQSGAS